MIDNIMYQENENQPDNPVLLSGGLALALLIGSKAYQLKQLDDNRHNFFLDLPEELDPMFKPLGSQYVSEIDANHMRRALVKGLDTKELESIQFAARINKDYIDLLDSFVKSPKKIVESDKKFLESVERLRRKKTISIDKLTTIEDTFELNRREFKILQDLSSLIDGGTLTPTELEIGVSLLNKTIQPGHGIEYLNGTRESKEQFNKMVKILNLEPIFDDTLDYSSNKYNTLTTIQSGMGVMVDLGDDKKRIITYPRILSETSTALTFTMNGDTLRITNKSYIASFKERLYKSISNGVIFDYNYSGQDNRHYTQLNASGTFSTLQTKYQAYKNSNTDLADLMVQNEADWNKSQILGGSTESFMNIKNDERGIINVVTKNDEIYLGRLFGVDTSLIDKYGKNQHLIQGSRILGHTRETSLYEKYQLSLLSDGTTRKRVESFIKHNTFTNKTAVIFDTNSQIADGAAYYLNKNGIPILALHSKDDQLAKGSVVGVKVQLNGSLNTEEVIKYKKLSNIDSSTNILVYSKSTNDIPFQMSRSIRSKIMEKTYLETYNTITPSNNLYDDIINATYNKKYNNNVNKYIDKIYKEMLDVVGDNGSSFRIELASIINSSYSEDVKLDSLTLAIMNGIKNGKLDGDKVLAKSSGSIILKDIIVEKGELGTKTKVKGIAIEGIGSIMQTATEYKDTSNGPAGSIFGTSGSKVKINQFEIMEISKRSPTLGKILSSYDPTSKLGREGKIVRNHTEKIYNVLKYTLSNDESLVNNIIELDGMSKNSGIFANITERLELLLANIDSLTVSQITNSNKTDKLKVIDQINILRKEILENLKNVTDNNGFRSTLGLVDGKLKSGSLVKFNFDYLTNDIESSSYMKKFFHDNSIVFNFAPLFNDDRLITIHDTGSFSGTEEVQLFRMVHSMLKSSSDTGNKRLFNTFMKEFESLIKSKDRGFSLFDDLAGKHSIFNGDIPVRGAKAKITDQFSFFTIFKDEIVKNLKLTNSELIDGSHKFNNFFNKKSWKFNSLIMTESIAKPSGFRDGDSILVSRSPTIGSSAINPMKAKVIGKEDLLESLSFFNSDVQEMILDMSDEVETSFSNRGKQQEYNKFTSDTKRKLAIKRFIEKSRKDTAMRKEYFKLAKFDPTKEGVNPFHVWLNFMDNFKVDVFGLTFNTLNKADYDGDQVSVVKGINPLEDSYTVSSQTQKLFNDYEDSLLKLITKDITNDTIIDNKRKSITELKEKLNSIYTKIENIENKTNNPNKITDLMNIYKNELEPILNDNSTLKELKHVSLEIKDRLEYYTTKADIIKEYDLPNENALNRTLRVYDTMANYILPNESDIRLGFDIETELNDQVINDMIFTRITDDEGKVWVLSDHKATYDKGMIPLSEILNYKELTIGSSKSDTLGLGKNISEIEIIEKFKISNRDYDIERIKTYLISVGINEPTELDMALYWAEGKIIASEQKYDTVGEYGSPPAYNNTVKKVMPEKLYPVKSVSDLLEERYSKKELDEFIKTNTLKNIVTDIELEITTSNMKVVKFGNQANILTKANVSKQLPGYYKFSQQFRYYGQYLKSLQIDGIDTTLQHLNHFLGELQQDALSGKSIDLSSGLQYSLSTMIDESNKYSLNDKLNEVHKIITGNFNITLKDLDNFSNEFLYIKDATPEQIARRTLGEAFDTLSDIEKLSALNKASSYQNTVPTFSETGAQELTKLFKDLSQNGKVVTINDLKDNLKNKFSSYIDESNNIIGNMIDDSVTNDNKILLHLYETLSETQQKHSFINSVSNHYKLTSTSETPLHEYYDSKKYKFTLEDDLMGGLAKMIRVGTMKNNSRGTVQQEFNLAYAMNFSDTRKLGADRVVDYVSNDMLNISAYIENNRVKDKLHKVLLPKISKDKKIFGGKAAFTNGTFKKPKLVGTGLALIMGGFIAGKLFSNYTRNENKSNTYYDQVKKIKSTEQNNEENRRWELYKYTSQRPIKI